MFLRWLLLALLAIGLVVTAVDLLLLDHHEDVWQSIPLILIGIALVVVVWHVAARNATSLRALQVLMMLFIVAGAAGVVLHYRGNMAFQLEMDATQSGWTLFNKVIRAKAPPAMAPAAMAQLGLIGLIYGFRHPALRPADFSPATYKGD
jgi:uncharacterized membrane protein